MSGANKPQTRESCYLPGPVSTHPAALCMYELSKSSLWLMLLFVCVLTVSLLICARLSLVLPKVPTRLAPYVVSTQLVDPYVVSRW